MNNKYDCVMDVPEPTSTTVTMEPLPLRQRLIINVVEHGAYEMSPFIIAVHESTGKHVPCWLEWHEGEGFDPAAARLSPQPKQSLNNVLERYRLLPRMEVTIDGRKRDTFRAVCDRSMGGEVKSVQCEGGTLWTMLPTNS